MASTSTCPFCGGIVKSSEKNCPHCGATNELYVIDTPKVVLTPHTIEELQEYCAERGMPLQRMRFFIGEDYKKPKAFGIYKESDGTVVVYKNKDTGERAIRYRGPDEEQGVRELYLKLLDECHKRNIWPDTPDGKRPKDYKRQAGSHPLRRTILTIIAAIIVVFSLMFLPVILPENAFSKIADSMLLKGIALGIPIGIHSIVSCFIALWLYYTNIKKIEFQTISKKCFRVSAIFGIIALISIIAYTCINKTTPLRMSASASWGVLLISLFIIPICCGLFMVLIGIIFPAIEKFLDKNFGRILCILFALSIFVNITISSYIGTHPNGYYVRNDAVYYRQGLSVYTYDRSDSTWERDFTSLDYDDYYGSDYDSELADDWDISYSDRFERTSEYKDYHSSNSNSGSSDSSSSYDSWDSGDTDWGSDW